LTLQWAGKAGEDEVHHQEVQSGCCHGCLGVVGSDGNEKVLSISNSGNSNAIKGSYNTPSPTPKIAQVQSSTGSTSLRTLQ